MIIAENAEKLEIAKYKEKMQLVLLENKKSPPVMRSADRRMAEAM